MIVFFVSVYYTCPMHFDKRDLFTIPNIMSYFRILLVPVFIIVYINSDSLSGNIWSIVVVLLSAATDILDGQVARRTGQVTDLGKILDPIADKAMQFAMMFCVVIKYRSVAVLIIIYAAKELISLAFSGYLFKHKKNIDGAMWCGKICTVILYAVMLTFIVIPDISSAIENILVVMAAMFMLLAFIIYMKEYIKLLIELKKEKRS